jgi:hypothetical protein
LIRARPVMAGFRTRGSVARRLWLTAYGLRPLPASHVPTAFRRLATPVTCRLRGTTKELPLAVRFYGYASDRRSARGPPCAPRGPAVGPLRQDGRYGESLARARGSDGRPVRSPAATALAHAARTDVRRGAGRYRDGRHGGRPRRRIACSRARLGRTGRSLAFGGLTTLAHGRGSTGRPVRSHLTVPEPSRAGRPLRIPAGGRC